MYKKSLLATAMGLLSYNAISASQEADSVAPEMSSAYQQKQSVVANDYMVVAANPLAVQAGYEVLKNGGNACGCLNCCTNCFGTC
ncbi:hypothetical protein ACLKMH_08635 [Psychromonas sp. KJ10-10]|uniref:hypothetical protein n=1 Tax=Psychromonas sp. KJ10-10 TaxID=3391823 RepID=UPI0039B65ECF